MSHISGLPGSIPAHAGETDASVGISRADEVDPRACGGDFIKDADMDGRSGRSPRMRGRRALGAAGWRYDGSIPAHAGETSKKNTNSYEKGVDPRACGGDEPVLIPLHLVQGRSPRMRGRRVLLLPVHP